MPKLAQPPVDTVQPANITRDGAERIAALYSGITPDLSLEEMIAFFKPRLVDDVVQDDNDSPAEVVVENGRAVIHLPASAPDWEKRFDLLHEAAHVLLHIKPRNVQSIRITRSYEDDSLPWEVEANWFALAVLMPKAKFVDLLTSTHSPIKVAEAFRLPLEVVAQRIKMLNLTEW